MTERSLILRADEVRAVLDGRKTMFRRPVATDPRPQSADTIMRGFPTDAQNVRMCGYYAKCDAPSGSHSVSYRVPCPLGAPGDRLFVRETYRRVPAAVAVPATFQAADWAIEYRADGCKENWCDNEGWYDNVPPADAPWRSPVLMPRQLSRLTLEVVSVRVERLTEISEEDCRAEGACIERFQYTAGECSPVCPMTETRAAEIVAVAYGPHKLALGVMESNEQAALLREFRRQWESIHGPGSWQASPYVWAVTFRKVDRP